MRPCEGRSCGSQAWLERLCLTPCCDVRGEMCPLLGLVYLLVGSFLLLPATDNNNNKRRQSKHSVADSPMRCKDGKGARSR
mmetsp:Transcript_10642/g.22455  ORF Transcript_10642/g.22455 Transcript_10642/m.22455 type:complete len:81 (-) Transcript_10642:3040-3282(-)